MEPERHRIVAVVVTLVAIVIVATRTPAARSDDAQDKKVKGAASQSAKAAKAFDTIMQIPDKAIPRDLLARAKAVAVFPQVLKVAFTVGGEGGRGVVSQHTSADEGLNAFPHALGRYAVSTSEDR